MGVPSEACICWQIVFEELLQNNIRVMMYDEQSCVWVICEYLSSRTLLAPSLIRSPIIHEYEYLMNENT